MSALAGTLSPKLGLASVGSPWLFEMLTKGHVCHVRVNKRPVIPTCFVSVTLSVGRPHSVLFKWACLQSVKSTAAVWNGSWSDRWTVVLSAFLPRVISSQVCEWQDLSHSPVDSETTHRDTGNPLAQYCCLTCSQWTAPILTQCNLRLSCDWITEGTVASVWGTRKRETTIRIIVFLLSKFFKKAFSDFSDMTNFFTYTFNDGK